MERFKKTILQFLAISSIISSSYGVTVQKFFAIRADGNPGSGSAADPYDGSAYIFTLIPQSRSGPGGFISRFDERMHQLTAAQNSTDSYQYILAPGTYWTLGDDNGIASKGYFLKANTTLSGAGIGLTVIKLGGWGYDPPYNVPNIHHVITVGNYAADFWHSLLVNYNNVTVQNLTVDCNATGLNLDPANFQNEGVCLSGIFLSGSNCTISNVEVLGAFGIIEHDPNTWNDINGVGFESFPLMISACGPVDIMNATIQNCVVRGSLGNYVSAISICGNSNLDQGPVTYASGIVSNNLVLGEVYCAYSGGNTVNSIYRRNVATGAQFGFRYDTGSLTNDSFVDNTFIATKGGFVLRNSGSTQANAPVSGITLSGNTLSAEGTPGGEPVSGVIDIGRTTSNFVMTSNNISAADSKPALYIGSASTGLTYTYNNSSLAISNPINAAVNYLPSAGTPGVALVGGSPSFNAVTASNLNITGMLTTNDITSTRNVDPIYRWNAPGGATNMQRMDMLYSGNLGQLFGRLLTDDNLTGVNYWLVLTRDPASPLIASRLDINATDIYANGLFHSGTIKLGSNNTVITSGSGSPNSTVYAPVGSLYLRNDAASPMLYIKQTGDSTTNTGWVTTQTPVGTIMDYAGSAAAIPAGWLLCDGRLLDSTSNTYSALYSVIGVTYGQSGSNFRLPDCRGRVTAGVDTVLQGAGYADRLTNSGTGNPGINSRIVGENGGFDRMGFTTVSQIPSHSHGLPMPTSTYAKSDTHNDNATTSNTGLRVTGISYATFPSTTSPIGGNASAPNGWVTDAHPNTQPTIVFCKIIKY